MQLNEEKEELRCHFCGFALIPNELALEISGRYVDYITRYQDTSSFTLCQGCRDKILQHTNEDYKICLKRREDAFGVGK